MGLAGQVCAHEPPAWIAAAVATTPHNTCHRPRITHLPEERRTVNYVWSQCNRAGRGAVKRANPRCRAAGPILSERPAPIHIGNSPPLGRGGRIAAGVGE